MKRVSKLFYYDEKLDRKKIPQQADFIHTTNSEFPIFIKEGVFSAVECDELVEQMLGRKSGGALTTFGGNVNSERKTLFITMSDDEQQLFYDRLDTAKPEIEEFYGLEITASEEVNALGYPPGGEYRGHCDNCMPVFNDNGEMERFELNMPHRFLTSILFLTDGVEEILGNNQCVGGNLMLNRFVDEAGDRFLIEPRKGVLISFPSNPHYQHQVYPVYEGFRVTLVDWHSAQLRE